ncbi:unnamed protein product [Adineta ricciae]|uniref:Uncharacterized protein n=1 Tax=Adineta ricciae TaxID=249248 RepID=A0A815J8T1_ADIRI|nr:unnamed protein product [Adineta ricciae]CAF1614774.1 unnamed protein product [Adineta ricciae]
MASTTDHSSQTIEENLAICIRRCGFQNVTLKDSLQVIDEQRAFEVGNETTFTEFVTNIADVLLKASSQSITKLHYGIIRGLIATVFRRVDSQRKKHSIQYLHGVRILRRGSGPFGVSVLQANEMHLKDVILNGMDFSELELPYIFLRNTSLINASFVNSNLEYADFTGAKLNGVKFLNTQLQNTDFTRASVRNIQLCGTTLFGSSITGDQIVQALIMYNTSYPNGTYARDKIYVVNGDAQQGTVGWNVTRGNIDVVSSSFTTNQDASMVQFIDLVEILNAELPDDIYYCVSFRYSRLYMKLIDSTREYPPNSYICYNQLDQTELPYLDHFVSVSKSLYSGAKRKNIERPTSTNKSVVSTATSQFTRHLNTGMHLPVKET